MCFPINLKNWTGANSWCLICVLSHVTKCLAWWYDKTSNNLVGRFYFHHKYSGIVIIVNKSSNSGAGTCADCTPRRTVLNCRLLYWTEICWIFLSFFFFSVLPILDVFSFISLVSLKRMPSLFYAEIATPDSILHPNGSIFQLMVKQQVWCWTNLG